ncbi:MAG: polyphenol oxidase family protein [Longimicrobiales bacterium]|nr:polyphenol oxidase family protein [Longimicrobiales bacterium]
MRARRRASRVGSRAFPPSVAMAPNLPGSIRLVTEERRDDPPRLVHPDWSEAFPWLVQGTSARGSGSAPFDLGLFSGGSSEAAVRTNWARLAAAAGADLVVHAPQPHGTAVRIWRDASEQADPDERLELVDPCDGHATDRTGVLLAVTTADCVPVFIVDPVRRSVAMVHAGWRGASSGILAEGLATMARGFATDVADVHVHLGPAICGRCYEVGPEVFGAFGLPAPRHAAPIDVRAWLAGAAVELGVDREKVSVSRHCTRCTGSRLFSHRNGDRFRQAGFLGIRG